MKIEMAMSNQQDLDQAIGLVDKMANLSDEERQIVKKHVMDAAQGDEAALARFILFPYNRNNHEIVGEILVLLMRD